MKEDILEQLVDEYLQVKGFFTVHNVKFQPDMEHADYIKRDDCVASDVDVIGFHPQHEGAERVWAVSCKSWQGGFDARDWIEAIEKGKIRHGRPAWKIFRELVKPKWASALLAEVERLTGAKQFTYVTAVTKLIGTKADWESYEPFKKNLGGNPIKILTLKEILDELNEKMNTTVASSEVGRLLQIIKASGWKP
jgi:hypothetical protein